MPKTKDLLHAIGDSGLKHTSGWVLEEFLPRLRGELGVKTYREMGDNSSVVGALLYAIRNLIMQAAWRIEAASDDAEAKRWAEFVEESLLDMSHTWEEFLVSLLSFLQFGWAYFEIVYKIRRGAGKDPRFRSKFDDGLLGWRKFGIRAQDSLWKWEIEHDGGIRGLWQQSVYGDISKGPVFIPIEKSVLFRTDAHKNNPEGRSILRNSVLDWHYLKRVQQIEAVGIERDMTGLLVMEMPPEILSSSATGEAARVRDAMFKQLSELKRDEREFAAVPSEVLEDGSPSRWKLKLLSSGGRRQIDTNAIVQRYSRNILMSVLAEVLMLGTEAGSWSLASSKTRMLSMAIGATMDNIASTFNRFGIARLMQLNGVLPELWPELVHGDIETPPLDELGRYVTALVAAGVPIDEAAQRKLLEAGKLPAPVMTEADIHLPGEGSADAAGSGSEGEQSSEEDEVPQV